MKKYTNPELEIMLLEDGDILTFSCPLTLAFLLKPKAHYIFKETGSIFCAALIGEIQLH